MDIPDTKSKGSFLKDYLRTFAKHKFLIIVPLVGVFLGSTIVGSTLPRYYMATASFRMLAPDSSGAVRRRSAQDDLEVMKQVILSRSNLVEVMKSKDVGLDASYRGLPEVQQEAAESTLVRQLRKNLEVQQKADGVFEVSYRCDDPDMAARIANAIMTQYHESVLKLEREQMEATVSSLTRSVEEYQAKVTDSGKELARFNAEHALELPGSELSNSTQLKNLRDQLAEKEAELSDAETAKKEIEKQLQEVDPVVLGEEIVGANPLIAQYRTQLDRLEMELATLRSRFTEIHPEIVKKKSEIESLKSLIEKAPEKLTTEEKRQANPVYVGMQQDLKKAEVRIASAKREKERLLERIADFEQRVRNAPALVEQMNTLMDKDTSNRGLLDYYTKELEKAKIEQEKEKDQKGTRFRILDYARESSALAKSNKFKVALLGLVLGGGLGLGLAVLRDQTDTSFKHVEDAASFLDVPIVGTIPVINTAAERAREKKKEALGWMIVGALVILLGAAMIASSLTSFPGG